MEGCGSPGWIKRTDKDREGCTLGSEGERRTSALASVAGGRRRAQCQSRRRAHSTLASRPAPSHRRPSLRARGHFLYTHPDVPQVYRIHRSCQHLSGSQLRTPSSSIGNAN